MNRVHADVSSEVACRVLGKNRGKWWKGSKRRREIRKGIRKARVRAGTCVLMNVDQYDRNHHPPSEGRGGREGEWYPP